MAEKDARDPRACTIVGAASLEHQRFVNTRREP
jgi:hypothetical protein